MRQRFVSILWITSFVLCLGAIVMSVRSFYVGEGIMSETSNRVSLMGSTRGGIGLLTAGDRSSSRWPSFLKARYFRTQPEPMLPEPYHSFYPGRGAIGFRFVAFEPADK